MSATVQDRVAPEFTGLARAWRSKMLAAAQEVGPAMRKIGDDAFADYGRRSAKKAHTGLRPETLLAIEQQWRAIPTAGRLGLAIRRDKRTLLIEDARISPATVANPAWGDDDHETSIVLVFNRLSISPARILKEGATIASISLHALSRFMQRSFDRSDVALVADLAVIAATAPTCIAAGGEFDIPTASGLVWRGSVNPFRDQYGVTRDAANVRTYRPHHWFA